MMAAVTSACVSLPACRADRDPAGHQVSAATPPDRDTPWFVDAAAETGLDFVHVNAMIGQFYYPEIIGSGVALLDYDNDGDLDVFMIQGQPFDRKGRPDRPQHGRLFRNDLTIQPDGTHVVRFTDVTRASGITATEYGMGAAVGDYDNDGCVDLYLTALGRNQLYRNNCDGTFTEIAAHAGVNDSGWSVSAAFLDFDRDGYLDLFVGHYLNWDLKANAPCFGASGRRVYCSPSVYRAQPSRLYHNNRDGTFTDVSTTAGIAAAFGPALGVATADFNSDGWIDFYVTNDGQENQLWINQRNGTFKDMGLLRGAAVSDRGKPKAGMGVDAGDFDDDGDEDLIVTNLSGEGHDLYVNDGSGTFDSRSGPSGFRFPTLAYTGFGTAWFDFDNDGWLDILTVNGTVQRNDALVRASDPNPLRQRKQLFRNLGNGQLLDVTNRAGPAFETLEVGRGVAFGDIDNDGDIDVIVSTNNGSPQVLLNMIGARNHWIGLRLVGAPVSPKRGVREGGPVSPKRETREGGRDMLGARVVVIPRGQHARWRRARSDGSYASANDPRVLVGLGSSTDPPRVRVIWPDGRKEEWAAVAVDRYTTLEEGTGK
jgi:hypothetical protein